MTAPVVPGAEAFRFDGGPIGALLIHGFTGSPASMRPMGEYLAKHEVASVGPRLPGHGTTWEDLGTTIWQDWEREAEAGLSDLAGRCSDVIVVGLSMGGGMALHLAAKHPDTLRGVVAINAYVHDPRLAAARVAGVFAKSRKGAGNDIKKPGQDEICNDRIPFAGLVTLGHFLRVVEGELPSISIPLLVFSSAEDHTVKPSNSKLIGERAGSSQKDLIRLTNSYHVATLDYDAELIFDRTLAFARSTARGAPAPEA